MTIIGIDVGTGSARAGVFNAHGQLLASSGREIAMWRPRPHWAQQSTEDIWGAICASVRESVATSGIRPEEVVGLGFDATCSLVLADADDRPISVDPGTAPEQDVIAWMDHRALADAEEINAIGGAPLRHVGEAISPEMQMPKLRWLQREMPDRFALAAHLWDLPDWLVWRACGSRTRSLCSLVCKWTYLGHLGKDGEGWDDGFLSAIGLAALTGPGGHARIGTEIAAPGTRLGGLTARAAAELGLPEGIAVGASLIDAYAGALGTLGAGDETSLAMIAGTSTCHIAVTGAPAYVPGVWGPYFGALLPGLWVNEGGQSAAGALIDTLLARHGAYPSLKAEALAADRHPATLLDARLAEMAEESATLTRARHVQPDAHGNRSPLAAPWRKGGIDGITLEAGRDDLALDYLATLQALAYGTRHILEEMRAAGAGIGSVVVSGGLAKNALYLRETADACGVPVIVPEAPEPVLLGSAMLGAVAAGAQPSLSDAMHAMAPAVQQIAPRGGAITAYHDAKYRVFRRMQADHAAYREIMAKV